MSKASGKRKRAVKKAADPWELLFSRDGELPAGEDEAEGLLYGEQGRRPMTQEEGRTAFGFWMIASLALCLIVALLAVSCAQRIGTETASEGRNGWIMILIALVAMIVIVIAADFRKAWKEQKKEKQKKASRGETSLHKEKQKTRK